MARSTSIDFLTTSCKSSDIIEDALRMIGVIEPGQTSGKGIDLLRAQRVLNQILKRDQQMGRNLLTLTRGHLFLTASQQSYTFGAATTHATTTYVETAIATAASETDLTITVDDDDGISSGDEIGIELDDGTMQWTTVNGAPVANVITITDALTDDAAVDSVVYTYTTELETPVRIIPQGIMLDLSGGSEQPVTLIARATYENTTAKDTESKITQVYYDRQYNSGVLYVWPTNDDPTDILHFTFERTIKDIDSHRNDMDIPVEAALYYTKMLASELALSFGLDLQKVAYIKQDAEMERTRFESWNSEQGSIFMKPDFKYE